MSPRIYTLPIDQTGWHVPGGGSTAFSREYLGMQVLIEGLALAAFGVIRDMATDAWRCGISTRSCRRLSVTSVRSSASKPAIS